VLPDNARCGRDDAQRASRLARLPPGAAARTTDGARPCRRFQNESERARALRGAFVLRSGKVKRHLLRQVSVRSRPADCSGTSRRRWPRSCRGMRKCSPGSKWADTDRHHAQPDHRASRGIHRKEPKEYGTCRYAEGASLVGRRFVLVEDVVSSGGAIVDALTKLRRTTCGPMRPCASSIVKPAEGKPWRPRDFRSGRCYVLASGRCVTARSPGPRIRMASPAGGVRPPDLAVRLSPMKHRGTGSIFFFTVAAYVRRCCLRWPGKVTWTRRPVSW